MIGSPMPAPRHLANAPITEAVIDLRVEQSSTEVSVLEPFCERVLEHYPNRQERTDWSAEVQFSEHGPALKTSAGGPSGYLLRSADGRQVVQGRLDGFTFSRMKPYADWASLKQEAIRLWREYVEAIHPTRVTRFAVRYINRIVLPLPIGRLDQYFLTRPEVGAEIPQEVNGLLMRLVVRVGEATAIITLASEPPTATDVPFLLDIDVFREDSIDPTSATIWERLDRLREYKNSIFFGSLTEYALGKLV